jgi:beta-glucosidase
MSEVLSFPKNFLWGSAVSSYQVEGGIENCDWSEKFPAGRACDYYNRYEEYFDIAKYLNQNVHRFSIEWSRIEPEEGKFDRMEIEHYKKMLLALRKREIKSMVTIWHFSLPIWLAKKGGWQSLKSVEHFENYSRFVVEELDDLADFWITMNEPMIYVYLSYVIGKFPPQKRNIFLVPAIFYNLVWAHKKAYKAIHDFNKKAKVGIAQNYSYVEPGDKESYLNKIASDTWNFFRNKLFLEFAKDYQDFLGVNYYFHEKVNFSLTNLPSVEIDGKVKSGNREVSDLEWEIFPEGIFYVLKFLKEYNLPIYITENGLADAKDSRRAKFIMDHLKWIHKAINDEGIDVRGYLYWSLLDNFEWADGFEPRFGLVEMDYKNMKTKIRPSAYEYAKICKNNAI